MYNNELILITRIKTGYDSIKQPIFKESKVSILCKEKSVGFKEFYIASNTDFKPELKVIVHDFEYNGETLCIYEGQKYKIIRVYTGQNTRFDDLAFDEVELTLQRAIGHE